MAALNRIDIDTLRRQILSPALMTDFGEAAEQVAVPQSLAIAWHLGTDGCPRSRWTVDQPPIPPS
jgi:hypothetical protein